jgi:hypothetical protein
MTAEWLADPAPRQLRLDLTEPPPGVHRVTLTYEQYLDRLIHIVPVACVGCGGEVLLHPPEDDPAVAWRCEHCTGAQWPIPFDPEDPA